MYVYEEISLLQDKYSFILYVEDAIFCDQHIRWFQAVNDRVLILYYPVSTANFLIN